MKRIEKVTNKNNVNAVFADLSSFNQIKEMVNDILSESSIKRRGFYNYNYILKLIEKNRKGLEDNSQLIWRLLTSEIWFRTFFN